MLILYLEAKLTVTKYMLSKYLTRLEWCKTSRCTNAQDTHLLGEGLRKFLISWEVPPLAFRCMISSLCHVYWTQSCTKSCEWRSHFCIAEHTCARRNRDSNEIKLSNMHCLLWKLFSPSYSIKYINCATFASKLILIKFVIHYFNRFIYVLKCKGLPLLIRNVL